MTHFRSELQENHDEDPEVTVSTATESPEAQTVRQAVLGTGRKVWCPYTSIFSHFCRLLTHQLRMRAAVYVG